MTTIREQVTEFHRAFGVPCPSVPEVPSAERCDLRVSLIGEEFCELLDALGLDSTAHCVREVLRGRGKVRSTHQVDLVEVCDALADLDYVVEGTRLEFGVNAEPIAAEVHRSNMAKLHNGVVVMREDGKIVKPQGWAPPDIEGELRKQGWTG